MDIRKILDKMKADGDKEATELLRLIDTEGPPAAQFFAEVEREIEMAKAIVSVLGKYKASQAVSILATALASVIAVAEDKRKNIAHVRSMLTDDKSLNGAAQMVMSGAFKGDGEVDDKYTLGLVEVVPILREISDMAKDYHQYECLLVSALAASLIEESPNDDSGDAQKVATVGPHMEKHLKDLRKMKEQRIEEDEKAIFSIIDMLKKATGDKVQVFRTTEDGAIVPFNTTEQ